MVTAAEAEAILANPKIIAANISWRRFSPNYRIEATVLILDTNEVCSLRGQVGRSNRSFVLLYNNTPIRKWTVHHQHRNPVTGEIVREPHKHTWDDVYEDKVVSIPNDIRGGDVNDELLDFLNECNITLRGRYLPFAGIPEFQEQLEFGLDI